MVRYRRPDTTGDVFLTLVTSNRERWLTSSSAIALILRAAREELAHHRWRLLAWVVMPDHLHALISPVGPVNGLNSGLDYPALVRGFKQAVTRGMGGREAGGARWQARYWEHCIRNDLDRQRHFDYIHWNPVKHGLAPHPGAWPHSSFHHYVKAGWYPDEWHPNNLPDLPDGRGE